MRRTKPRRKPLAPVKKARAATKYITIPRTEYDRLNCYAALLDMILHDHTPHYDSVDIVRNVLIDQAVAEEGGVGLVF